MNATPGPPPGSTAPPCPNCGTQRAPVAQFCHACGQATWDRTPTVRQIAREYRAQYVGADGALWRTLGLLMLPGRLTVEYLQGRRRRYIHPIRLYLMTSVLCFLALRLAASLPAGADRSDPAARGADAALVSETGTRALRVHADGAIDCDLPRWACDRIQRRYAVEPQRLQAELEALQGRFLRYLPYALFLLLPLFAALMQLVYRARRMHYAEHLVFALHLHAFWFTALWIAALAPAPLDALLAAFLAVYALLAMRRVYGGRWLGALARAAVVAPIYLVAMLAATVGAALLATIA